jgi:hypothetical protein
LLLYSELETSCCSYYLYFQFLLPVLYQLIFPLLSYFTIENCLLISSVTPSFLEAEYKIKWLDSKLFRRLKGAFNIAYSACYLTQVNSSDIPPSLLIPNDKTHVRRVVAVLIDFDGYVFVWIAAWNTTWRKSWVSPHHMTNFMKYRAEVFIRKTMEKPWEHFL